MEIKESTPDVKEDVETISELESKIIRQIEYYFGNYNLSRDRFLKEQTQENDGWIPFETLVRFNRLKQLSEDHEVIANAMRKAPNKLMEVNEDGSKIRRCVDKPIPDEDREQIEKRSLYVKGFKEDSTLDELLEFFKKHNNPESICMRRKKPNKKFKGSVFVTFNTSEDADKFLELKNLKYKGVDLLREWKADYLKRKNASFEEFKKQQQKRKKQTDEMKTEDKEIKQEISESDIVKGCLMKLSELSSETMWEDIKEALAPYGEIAFVDYSMGLPQATVRFSAGVAADVLEKASTEGEDGLKRIMIGEVNAVATIVKGEDEVEYWQTVASAKSRRKTQGFPKKGWQNRGGRHGRGKGNKRRRRGGDDEDNDDDTKEEPVEVKPPAKALKTNDSVNKDDSSKTSPVEEMKVD